MTPLRISRPSPDTVAAWQPRVTAGVTAALLLAFLAGAPAALLVLLLPDFLARAIDRREWAWIARLARHVVPSLLPAYALTERSYWPPKRFASRLGLGLLTAIVGTSLAGVPALAIPLAGAMAGLCVLESAFGVCVACTMYTLLGRLGWVTACPNGQCTVGAPRA